ncbi:hypothetical protein [Streptomyces kasugaensis]|uniref:hypothetical protein n=1 Tax=Streptomyces kasugaensis TaxID=1946 RepID=UPI001A94E3DC|nr:hypothetical protein [Streptomyces kasugaensis]
MRNVVIRSGLPDRWACSLLIHLTSVASHEMVELTGVGVVVQSLIAGLGSA